MQLARVHFGGRLLLYGARSSPCPPPGRRPTQASARRKSQLMKEMLPEIPVPVVDKLEWESPLKVAHYPHPCLRAVNARVNVFDESLAQLAKEMFEVMYTDDGVGLAAPQVGVNVRVMVFNESGDPEQPEQQVVLVNPEIVSKSEDTVVEQEGCLSFPRIRGEVKRSFRILVRAMNERGEPVELSLSDWTARIFQHEFDHLQGVLFHDRMLPDSLAKVHSKLVAMEDAFLAGNPGVVVRRVPALAPPRKVSKGFA